MSGEWQTDLKIFGAALFAYFAKGAVFALPRYRRGSVATWQNGRRKNWCFE